MTALPLEGFPCETQRLCLRVLTEGDEVLFRRIYTDAETMRHIGSHLSDDEANSAFRSILAAMRGPSFRCVYLVIVDKASRESLGICGIPKFDPSAINHEVGLVLTEKARSRGLAREALSALVNRIFVATSASEVYAWFSTGHVAARHLVVAAGFSSCDEVESSQEFSTRQRWSIRRSCWRGVHQYQPWGATDV